MDANKEAFLIDAAGNLAATLIQLFRGMGNDGAADAVDAAIREHSHETYKVIIAKSQQPRG